MESPRRRGARVKYPRLTAKEFNKEIETFLKRIRQTDSYTRKLYSSKAKEVDVGDAEVGEGGKLDKKTLKKWRSDLLKDMEKRLKGYYREALRKKDTKRKVNINSGVNKPIAVSSAIVNFFQEANLGDATTVGGAPGQSLLAEVRPLFFTEQLSNRSLLTALFSLYALVNRLADMSEYNRTRAADPVPDKTKRNGGILGADQLMRRVFGDSFVRITQKGQAKLTAEGVQDLQQKPQRLPGERQRSYYHTISGAVNTRYMKWNDFYHLFSPDNFTYGNFQSITADNTLKEGTPEYNNYAARGVFNKLPDNEVQIYTDAVKAQLSTGNISVDFTISIAAEMLGTTVDQLQTVNFPWYVRAKNDSDKAIISAVLKIIKQ